MPTLSCITRWKTFSVFFTWTFWFPSCFQASKIRQWKIYMIKYWLVMSCGTGHLSLLLTQVKGCVLSLQLSCHHIATDRLCESSEEDFFLESFLPFGSLQRQHMHSPLAVAGRCVFLLKGAYNLLRVPLWLQRYCISYIIISYVIIYVYPQ